MVGLPARGKTFISLRLQRYLEWQGLRVKTFNAGSYRRALLGHDSSQSAFFDPHAEGFAREREMIAKRCFADSVSWLIGEGDIVIYDATNVTSERREYLKRQCEWNGFDYIFVENICDDPMMLDWIINDKMRNSIDYKGDAIDAAKNDFVARIRHYESVYEPLDGALPYIKVFNFGERLKWNFGPGHGLFIELAEFIGSINLAEKKIYITRHGETFFNREDRIGGDSLLTEKGMEYAKRLRDYFKDTKLVVFTSSKRRTVETAGFFDCERLELAELNEISSGVCDGLTYEEIAQKHPEINGGRKTDKFNFRYPEGESYRDLIQRVKKAVIKIESQRKDVLVIAHRAVNRCLFSYFMPTAEQDIPYIDMPLNKIIKITHDRALYNYTAIDL